MWQWIHNRTQSGDKSPKCNQCDYASNYAGNLRAHLKTHSGEKAYKCDQCGYTSYHAGKLRTHLKHTVGKRPTNATNQIRQIIWGDSWEHTAGKGHANATNMTLHPTMQAGRMRLCLFPCMWFQKTFERERAFKCHQCEYASSEAGNLRRHLKTHSREKWNTCN